MPYDDNDNGDEAAGYDDEYMMTMMLNICPSSVSVTMTTMTMSMTMIMLQGMPVICVFCDNEYIIMMMMMLQDMPVICVICDNEYIIMMMMMMMMQEMPRQSSVSSETMSIKRTMMILQ